MLIFPVSCVLYVLMLSYFLFLTKKFPQIKLKYKNAHSSRTSNVAMVFHSSNIIYFLESDVQWTSVEWNGLLPQNTDTFQRYVTEICFYFLQTQHKTISFICFYNKFFKLFYSFVFNCPELWLFSVLFFRSGS